LIEMTPAFLWDMDGTLFDSKETHFISWQHALQMHGYTLDRQIYNANFGRNNRANVPLFLGFEPEPDLYDTIVETKERVFRQIAAESASLVPGVQSWLTTARNAHIPQVVASSAPMVNIETLLAEFGLISFFDHLISGEDMPAKPEPDIFLAAAQVVQRAPDHCWVIEDSLPGIMAAKNAGMRCIAVATSHPASELSMADVILTDFTTPLAKVISLSD